MGADRLSYVHRTSSVPLLNNTLGGALDQAAASWPAREALVACEQNIRLTFAGLREAADRLAAGMIALGLEPGDRVGIWSPNRAEWIITQYLSLIHI